MALEFIFENDSDTDFANLHQGDILRRNDRLVSVLEQVHNYYATAEDYTHFMVLTQSCDLYLRSGKPKARYITLAAIRPLELVVDRLIEKYAYSGLELPLSVCDKTQETRVKQTLERLLHNTQDGLFFIKKDSHPKISNDLCVFLQLSVAIRTSHYEECLSAKVAQLDNIFQAKVGWLVGNMYSRIGTPDLEEHEPEPEKIKQQFLDDVIYTRSAWLSPTQLKIFKKDVKAWTTANPGEDITDDVVKSILAKVPDMIDLVSDRIIDQLKSEKFLPDDDEVISKVKNLLLNDTALMKMIRTTT